MEINIKIEILEGIFIGGIGATIIFLMINLFKFGIIIAFSAFGIASLFWLMFIFVGELIKLNRKVKPKNNKRTLKIESKGGEKKK